MWKTVHRQFPGGKGMNLFDILPQCPSPADVRMYRLGREYGQEIVLTFSEGILNCMREITPFRWDKVSRNEGCREVDGIGQYETSTYRQAFGLVRSGLEWVAPSLKP